MLSFMQNAKQFIFFSSSSIFVHKIMHLHICKRCVFEECRCQTATRSDEILVFSRKKKNKKTFHAKLSDPKHGTHRSCNQCNESF